MEKSSERVSKIGRPPKFGEPRRPVTVTLPERTLAQLDAIDPDRARAIVKAADTLLPQNEHRNELVNVVEVLPGQGVIIVGPSRSLSRIKWLRLVEVAPLRYLLVLPSGASIDSLELAIIDLLEHAETDHVERAFLERLRDLIRTPRRGGKLSTAELVFVNTSD